MERKYTSKWYQAVGCTDCLKIYELPTNVCPNCGDSKLIYTDVMCGWVTLTVRRYSLSQWNKPLTWFKEYYEVKEVVR